jgi:hypothetical protein
MLPDFIGEKTGVKKTGRDSVKWREREVERLI